MNDREIVQCLFNILDAQFPCIGLPTAERVKREFMLRGFENVIVRNDGAPQKFTVFGSAGRSGCRSSDDLITAASRIALALRAPSIARESLCSLYPDGRFRVIITLKD